MKRRRPCVPQRKLYFAGCEGDTERAYVILLNSLALERGIHISIHAEVLNPGAGDPLALVARAAERLARKRRQGTRYRRAVVFLDSDTSSIAPERTQKSVSAARKSGIQLIWQKPNFEAVLLRHLDGCDQLQPSADQSLDELKRRWPEYDKGGITAKKLSHRIGYSQLEQAALVEPDLGDFLRTVGLI